MTYRIDPKRKAAQQWHDLLNQSIHYILRDPRTGRTVAQGHSLHAPAIKAAQRFRSDLLLIHVDAQI